ncbi:Hypothetical predicted protein [Mytilus galloprovincialis]|uniref:SWIM-type domain-containing protein n=1 Tax=Mytilus galloprovincialis TaxID=29158 RepID=A0A8B6F961_MYTGA|nr:Hypothetical predicted protein [Mytilus galloprovincialis]
MDAEMSSDLGADLSGCRFVLLPKNELASRGAVGTGRKADLIERLRAYDRNQNFKNPVIHAPEPLEVEWPVSGFKQLKKEHKVIMPKLSREQIEAYFLYRMAEDNVYSGDLQSMTKGQLMFESHRVLACSILKNDNGIFLSGVVGAAMKKKVTYNYRLKLEKSSGDPLNSHCECPAGRGPHGSCKHVAAVLIMISDFITTGNVNTGRSCTDTLMMFTKPKSSYSGSPVKAEKLPTKRKLAPVYLADPRPLKYRNCPGYNDHIKNTVTNFCSVSSMDLSIRYLYEKADIQVTQSDVDLIERSTRLQSCSPKWLEERRWRLTASTFGEICKVTSRRNTNKFCHSLFYGSNIQSKALSHGKNYEAKALKAFNLKFDKNAKRCGFYVSIDKSFLGASPDAILEDGKSIVEIKCPYNGRNEDVKPGPNFKFLQMDSNGNIVLKESSNYYDQIQGQLFVTKRSLCYFVVYTLCDLFVQKISLNEEYCNNCLVPKLESFYQRVFRPYVASTL